MKSTPHLMGFCGSATVLLEHQGLLLMPPLTVSSEAAVGEAHHPVEPVVWSQGSVHCTLASLFWVPCEL